jgi:hypothetical protein
MIHREALFWKEGGEMEAKVREFRKRVRRENAGRRGRSLRYSRELRMEAVAYLARKKREGVGQDR